MAELRVDVDDEALSATAWALLAHTINHEIAGELDEAVVQAGFSDDENAREDGVDACTIWVVL